MDHDEGTAMATITDGTREAELRMRLRGDLYGNFIGDEGKGRVEAGFAPADRDRLARVKAEWDPENRFPGNQNIRPITTEVTR